jgi:hypothetical protein
MPVSCRSRETVSYLLRNLKGKPSPAMSIFLRVIVGCILDIGWLLVPRRRNQTGFPLVYVSLDGSVRELSEREKEHVSQKFMFGDGARPWIKPTYRSRDGWGNLSGYVERRRLPSRIAIHPVNPNYDMAAKDLKVDILGMQRAIGDSLVKNDDGSVRCTPNPNISRAERIERGRKYQAEQLARREALAKMPE